MGAQRYWVFAAVHGLLALAVVPLLMGIGWPLALTFVAMGLGFFVGAAYGRQYMRYWGVLREKSKQTSGD